MLSTEEPNLFRRVNDSLLDGTSDWCTPAKAYTLASMVLALRPRTVVEIGVWTGGSFLPLALAASALGTWTDINNQRPARCTVIGIDPWDPAASAEGQIPINADWWGHAPHEWAYTTVKERVAKFGVTEYTELIRAKSDDVVVPANIGILHIDGNHGDQVMRDTERFAANVRVGGICILDDFHWDGGSVKRAGEMIEKNGFRPMYEIDTKSFGRVFQRLARP